MIARISIHRLEHKNQVLQICNAECHYADSCNAECHYGESSYAECRYAEFCYTECHYAEYAESRYILIGPNVVGL